MLQYLTPTSRLTDFCMQIDYKSSYKLRTKYCKSEITKYQRDYILWLRKIDIFNIKFMW